MNAQIELLKTPNADLPKHITKRTSTVINHTPNHVDYIEAGHAYPLRYYRSGPLDGTSIEMSPQVIERNNEVLGQLEVRSK